MKIIWISPNGSDTTGSGSYEDPYKTIEHGLLYFTDGDQIRLASGTYVPTDSIVISGLSGSIFAEDALGAFIQPEKTRLHAACVAILACERFNIQGINVLQASDNTGNLIGIYAENVNYLTVCTCAVTDFEIPSGNGCGIFGSGSNGRIENCVVENFVCDGVPAGSTLHGIKGYGIPVIDCHVSDLTGNNDCAVTGILEDGCSV